MRIKVIILGFVLLIVTSHPGHAGTVVLKSGIRVEGRILEKTDDSVTVMSNVGTKLTFYNDEIAKVFDDDPKPSAPETAEGVDTNLIVKKKFERYPIPETLPAEYVKKINEIPDIVQINPLNGLPDAGQRYCGPAGVSNGLMWLDEHGFGDLVVNSGIAYNDQIKLTRLLGAKNYMNSAEQGTTMTGILETLDRFIQEKGYQYKRLEYRGVMFTPPKYKVGDKVDLEWIKRGIHGYGVVWLAVGYYKVFRDSKNVLIYKRLAGHLVTMVGYGQDETGKKDPDYLIVHDPAAKFGYYFSNSYVKAEKIDRGRFNFDDMNQTITLKDIYELSGKFEMPPEANVTILDGVIVLEMPQPE